MAGQSGSYLRFLALSRLPSVGGDLTPPKKAAFAFSGLPSPILPFQILPLDVEHLTKAMRTVKENQRLGGTGAARRRATGPDYGGSRAPRPPLMHTPA